jgi:tRNA(Ile2) C34 agmatinyltransferase TiaS
MNGRCDTCGRETTSVSQGVSRCSRCANLLRQIAERRRDVKAVFDGFLAMSSHERMAFLKREQRRQIGR